MNGCEKNIEKRGIGAHHYFLLVDAWCKNDSVLFRDTLMEIMRLPVWALKDVRQRVWDSAVLGKRVREEMNEILKREGIRDFGF
jgi:hypothetical protein